MKSSIGGSTAKPQLTGSPVIGLMPPAGQPGSQAPGGVAPTPSDTAPSNTRPAPVPLRKLIKYGSRVTVKGAVRVSSSPKPASCMSMSIMNALPAPMTRTPAAIGTLPTNQPA